MFLAEQLSKQDLIIQKWASWNDGSFAARVIRVTATHIRLRKGETLCFL